MRFNVIGRARSLWLLCLVACTAGGARAQVISEAAGDGVARFHASAEARKNAHPSYALEKPLVVTGTAPASFVVRPVFASEGQTTAVTIPVDAGTSVYGTGEVAGPLLRNGRSIICWNTDAYGYDDKAPSLYQAHPWVLAVRADGSAYGVLADTTYRCEVDLRGVGSSGGQIVFRAPGPAFPVLVIDRPTPEGVLRGLADLTGRMPLPPKWSLGYHQCRYSYFPEARVREIASEFRERDIPCDVIWFDIDYMEGFRVFTFDRKHFPDPAKLNSDLLADGFHNVWMIDPGLKSRLEASPNEPAASVYAAEPEAIRKARDGERGRFQAIMEAGNKAGVWVTAADGKVYEGEVWPGWCNFPDYTRPAVREWWAGLYGEFLAQDITGVWNDMNEPAVFNVKSKTMPEDNIHLGDAAMTRPDGTPQGEAGAKGNHARYHNVYGMQMIRGTREGIQAIHPDRRPFVLSRANYIGGQRYGATWTGDNSADWYHLEASIPMALNVGLSGQPFIGPDIGGFAGNGPSGGEGKLMARWMGIGALLPFSRGHTGKENIDKEPWAFGPEVEATCRRALERRYRLMPYFYTLFREASVSGVPVARPVFFADPRDPALRSEDDSFLLGPDLLVSAQVSPDGRREPLLPRGVWRGFRFEQEAVDPDLPELYVRGGGIIPLGPVMEFVDEKPLNPLTLLVSLDAEGKAEGWLYEDAGDGYGYREGDYLLTRYRATLEGKSVTVTVAESEGKRARPARQVEIRVLLDTRTGADAAGQPRTVAGVVVGHGTDGEPVRIALP